MIWNRQGSCFIIFRVKHSAFFGKVDEAFYILKLDEMSVTIVSLRLPIGLSTRPGEVGNNDGKDVSVIFFYTRQR